jgi:hypothetical protein
VKRKKATDKEEERCMYVPRIDNAGKASAGRGKGGGGLSVISTSLEVKV